MDARVKPAHDAECSAASCSISNSHFKQPRACVLAWPTRGELLFSFPLDIKGKRSAERRIVTSRGVSPGSPGNRGTRQRLAALRRGVLKPRSVLPGTWLGGDFAPPPVPVQPRQRQSPVVGPDGNPRPPESVGANHSRRRRIRPAWVTPPGPSFRSVPLRKCPREAPLTGQDTAIIRAARQWGITIPGGFEKFNVDERKSFPRFPGRSVQLLRNGALQSRGRNEHNSPVMRGLDPRIHLLRKSLSSEMDCRPGNDGPVSVTVPVSLEAALRNCYALHRARETAAHTAR